MSRGARFCQGGEILSKGARFCQGGRPHPFAPPPPSPDQCSNNVCFKPTLVERQCTLDSVCALERGEGQVAFTDTVRPTTQVKLQRKIHLKDPHYSVYFRLVVYTENCKLVVRLQMQNTLGIVVIGQLDE